MARLSSRRWPFGLLLVMAGAVLILVAVAPSETKSRSTIPPSTAPEPATTSVGSQPPPTGNTEPSIRDVDLDSDGKPDVAIVDGQVIQLHNSDGGHDWTVILLVPGLLLLLGGLVQIGATIVGSRLTKRPAA